MTQKMLESRFYIALFFSYDVIYYNTSYHLFKATHHSPEEYSNQNTASKCLMNSRSDRIQIGASPPSNQSLLKMTSCIPAVAVNIFYLYILYEPIFKYKLTWGAMTDNCNCPTKSHHVLHCKNSWLVSAHPVLPVQKYRQSSDGISRVAYILARVQSWRPPGDRSLLRRKPVSSPHQSPAWPKAQVCPTTCQKKRQTTRRWNCCHRPSPSSSGSRKQELGHDADFVKNHTTNLNSSLAPITLKINFRPPLTGGLSWWEHLFCSPACSPSPGRRGASDGKQNPASAPQLVKGLRAERNHSQPQGCLWLPGFDCSASRPWWKDHHALQEGKKYCNHGFG